MPSDAEKAFYSDIAQFITSEQPDKRKLAQKKYELCKKHSLKKVPTDIQIVMNTQVKYPSKPIRSASGVHVVAIMSKPHRCPHGVCTYCPGGIKSPFGDVPQSYTGKEPSTMRGIRNFYDAYAQVFNRLEQYCIIDQIPQKIELIIMGGTFLSLDKEYVESFIGGAYKAMNDFSDMFFDDKSDLKIDEFKTFFELPGDVKDKEREKRNQERIFALRDKEPIDIQKEITRNDLHGHVKCVGMTIETRADHALEKHADWMLEMGCTRIELGVQSVYDDVLKKINRGHPVQTNLDALQILKDSAFKINFHYNPGLPTPEGRISKERDLAGMKQLFEDENYMPDMIKVYPCMVFPGTALFHQWKRGKFEPLSTEEAAEIIAEFFSYVPEYCRVMRVQRDIPSFQVEEGVKKTNLRQMVEEIMKQKNIVSKDIRARESRNSDEDITDTITVVREYRSSHGTEYFISEESKDKKYILGFCRLRFPSNAAHRPEMKGKTSTGKDIAAALIRELHVYGQATKIGDIGKTQHRGIGKKLVAKAEEIAKEHQKNKMLIISGIGVRGYYRTQNYKLEGPYMIKEI